VSVVFPAYNEEKRIGETLWLYGKYLDAQVYDYELIVVDDGSTDNTAGMVRAMFPDVRVIQYGANRGKGCAVRTGMMAAQGAFRLFSDADGSTPVEEIEKAWVRFAMGADIVIGSRSLPDSDVQKRQRVLRESMGRTFNLFVKSLLGHTFIDTQCGFKCFTAESAHTVFSRQTLDGFSCDPEMLYIALKYGLKIAEIPVCWRNSPDSRVRLVADSFWMFADLLKVRYNDLNGRYAGPVPPLNT
jgi:dolichyl-phosphate beta-glucosyltransferase